MMNKDNTLITNEYLLEHTTKMGAYTSSQMTALGLTWPPKRGWKNKLIGTYLTFDQASIFEKAEYKKKLPKSLSLILNKLDKLTDQQLTEISIAVHKERESRL